MVSLICRILKKNDTNELFYKTEIDSRLKRMNLWLQEVGWRGWRIGWEFGINMYIHTAIFKTDNQQGQGSTV